MHNKYNKLAIISLCTNIEDPKTKTIPLTNIQYVLLVNKLFKSSVKAPNSLLEGYDKLEEYFIALALPEPIKIKM